MKKIFYFLCTLMVFSVATESISIAQQKKFKFSRVSRDTKKEAKKLEKDGYKVFVGDPPIAQQLNDAYTKRNETDDDGFPKYILGNGTSIANSEAAAQMQALELAKLDLVSQIETNMRVVIENEVGNKQLQAEDASSITNTMQVSVNKVAKKLQRVMTFVKYYRVLTNKNIEVKIRVGYSYALAQKAILDEMRLAMEQESENMKVKYDQFLNPEKYKEGEIKNIKEEE